MILTSFEAVARALGMDLPAHQKWVYAMVCHHVNNTTGRCDPSVGTLANEVGICKSAVKVALRELKAADLVIPRPRRDGTTNLTNSYFLPGVHSALVGQDTPQVGQDMPEGGAQLDLGVGRVVPPNKEPKQRREQSKDSSRKRETGTDPRYQEFVMVLSDYWKSMNPEIPFDLTSKDGAQLKALLKDRKGMTRDLFHTCLVNRSNSDAVTHAEAPCYWLARVMRYAAEPLNQYGQPKGGVSNGTRNQQGSGSTANRAQDRSNGHARDAESIYEELFS